MLQQETALKPEEAGWDDSMLTVEEKQMVDDFAKQIDLKNSNLILQYGAGAQKKMADFSEKALDNVKTQDLGEVGELLGSVVSELKSFDAEEERGVFRAFQEIREQNHGDEGKICRRRKPISIRSARYWRAIRCS